VRLVHGHAFLAEYKRELLLLRGSEAVAREELFFDSGGYSRVNLYRLSPSQYRLTTIGNHFYDVDLTAEQILAVPGADAPVSAAGSFVGAFDWSPRRNWRFVPAAEREEIPIGMLELDG
jgi:hypothetical protein